MADTPNLVIPHIVGASGNQYVTGNEGLDALDEAGNDFADIVITGAKTLTAAEFNRNFRIHLTGTPGAPFILDTPAPANKRFFAIDNDTDDVATIRCNGAGATVTVDPLASAVLYCDATDIIALGNLLALVDGPASYGGHGNKLVSVKATEDGFEFISAAAGASGTKAAVRVAATAAGTLASDFENGDTLDGVVLATGDRILLPFQVAAAANGIYTVNASGAPTRATDFDTAAEAGFGVTVPVVLGDVNKNTLWQHTTAGTIILETTALTFAQIFAPSRVVGFMSYIPGKPAAAALLLRLYFQTPHSFPVNFAGSLAKARVASAASAVLDVKKNGASIGSLTYATSATGAFSIASAQSFAAGDFIDFVAPNPQDSTLEDISITIVGSK